ncbi:MAG: hypothetical protein JWM04_2140 [Verrucomicrobiales bacterium]|nr:hypothetical protein [Verrucomicrobiales bacterium]
MKFRLLFLLLISPFLALGQNGTLKGVYVPRVGGLETEVTLSYSFQKKFGFNVFFAAKLAKSGAGAYWHKGKRYTSDFLGKECFEGLKFSLPTIEVNVYDGELLMGSFKRGFVMDSISFGGDSQDLPSILGIKSENVSEAQLRNWSLRNLRIISAGLETASEGEKKLLSAIERFEAVTAYASRIKEADSAFSAKRYDDAKKLYSDALSQKPEESYPKTRLDEIARIEREAAKAKQAREVAQSKTNNPSTKQIGAGDDFWASGKPSSKTANATTAKSPSSDDDFWQNSKRPPTLEAMTPAERKAYGEKKAEEVMVELNSRNKLANGPTAAPTEAQMESNEANFRASLALRDRWDSLKSRQRLQDTEFANTSQIDAAYREQLRAINTSADEIRENAAPRIQAASQEAFADQGETGRAIGGIVGLLGTAINNSDVERERREAKAELERERDQQIARIEARKRAAEQERARKLAEAKQMQEEARRLEVAARIEMRQELLTFFPEGHTPLSSHKVTADELYFFAYAANAKETAQEKPPIHISNVFPIASYGDGSWPYKQSFSDELAKLTSVPPTVVGYFTTRAAADKMRNSLLQLSGEAGFEVSEIQFKGKPASAQKTGLPSPETASGKENFGGIDSTNKVKAQSAQDDFWTEKSTVSGSKKAAEAKDDFWKVK